MEEIKSILLRNRAFDKKGSKKYHCKKINQSFYPKAGYSKSVKYGY
jgi:hypothetical protein